MKSLSSWPPNLDNNSDVTVLLLEDTLVELVPQLSDVKDFFEKMMILEEFFEGDEMRAKEYLDCLRNYIKKQGIISRSINLRSLEADIMSYLKEFGADEAVVVQNQLVEEFQEEHKSRVNLVLLSKPSDEVSEVDKSEMLTNAQFQKKMAEKKKKILDTLLSLKKSADQLASLSNMSLDSYLDQLLDSVVKGMNKDEEVKFLLTGLTMLLSKMKPEDLECNVVSFSIAKNEGRAVANDMKDISNLLAEILEEAQSRFKSFGTTVEYELKDLLEEGMDYVNDVDDDSRGLSLLYKGLLVVLSKTTLSK